MSMPITRVHVTWAATAVARQVSQNGPLEAIGDQHRAWTDPGGFSVGGAAGPGTFSFPWQDPQGQPLEPDRSHWLTCMGLRELTGDVKPAFVTKMFDHAVPLRADIAPTITLHGAPAWVTRHAAELHVQPLGATALLRLTLQFDDPVADLPGLQRHLDQLETTVEVELNGQRDPIRRQVASLAALTRDRLGTGPAPSDSRVVTVVDAAITDPYADPRAATPTFLFQLRTLAGLTSAAPVKWLKTTQMGPPSCDPGDLRVLASTGMAQWLQGALAARPADPRRQTVGQHRIAVLHWTRAAYLRGIVDGPAHAQRQLESLRRRYRQLAGSIYGPAPIDLDFVAQGFFTVNPVTGLTLDAVADGWCPPPAPPT